MTCLRLAAAGYFCTIQSTVLRQPELIEMRKLRQTGLDGLSPVERILSDAIEDGMGLEDLESRVYAAALTKTKGNVSAAARLLKISRAQLDYRIIKGGINRKLA